MAYIEILSFGKWHIYIYIYHTVSKMTYNTIRSWSLQLSYKLSWNLAILKGIRYRTLIFCWLQNLLNTLFEFVVGLLEFLLSYRFKAVLCIFGKSNTIPWRVFTECNFWSSSCDSHTRKKGCFETLILESWHLMPKRNMELVQSNNTSFLDPLIRFLYSMGNVLLDSEVNLIMSCP